MKFRIFLSIFFFISFGNMTHLYADDGKFRVVTTFTIIQDIAREVAGDAAVVSSITKLGAEIHGYQPTPRDIVRAQQADLILWNGLGLEAWFQVFFTHFDSIPEVTVSEGIEIIPIREGEYAGKPNPHGWMSLTNARKYVNNVRDALMKYDAPNAEIYAQNARAYIARLERAYSPLQAQIATIPEENRWLVTSEGAFSYLAQDLGLKEVYLWPINADQVGTPQQVRSVIDTVRKHNIPVVFSESTVSDKPMKRVARETGAHYGGVLYVDSLSHVGGATPSYLELLRTTTKTIVSGLQASQK